MGRWFQIVGVALVYDLILGEVKRLLLLDLSIVVGIYLLPLVTQSFINLIESYM